MKLLNKKQRNNGGFSLVELIVVIAIMVVLVAVLAPVFTRYIESSRRSTDVQNANSISEAILAEVADDASHVVAGTATEVNATNIANINSLQSAPEVKGHDATDGQHFWYFYDSGANLCYVYVNNSVSAEKTLTTDDGAKNYKDNDTV